jgi:hypothetical protein
MLPQRPINSCLNGDLKNTKKDSQATWPRVRLGQRRRTMTVGWVVPHSGDRIRDMDGVVGGGGDNHLHS